MTDEQLQKAIEKYVTIIVGDGVRLENYQKFFYEKLSSVAIKLMHIQVERAGLIPKEDASMIPLLVEDKHVRRYLWDRGLVAVEDRCMRSHPHEKMNEYCQHKTELARLMNKEAQDDARKNT